MFWKPFSHQLIDMELVVDFFVDGDPDGVVRLDGQSFNEPGNHRPSDYIDQRLWESVSLSLEARSDATNWDNDIESIIPWS